MNIDLERSYIHERKRPETNPPKSREKNEQHKEETNQRQKKRK